MNISYLRFVRSVWPSFRDQLHRGDDLDGPRGTLFLFSTFRRRCRWARVEFTGKP